MRYFITNVLPHHLSGKYKISYAAANFSWALIHSSVFDEVFSIAPLNVSGAIDDVDMPELVYSDWRKRGKILQKLAPIKESFLIFRKIKRNSNVWFYNISILNIVLFFLCKWFKPSAHCNVIILDIYIPKRKLSLEALFLWAINHANSTIKLSDSPLLREDISQISLIIRVFSKIKNATLYITGFSEKEEEMKLECSKYPNIHYYGELSFNRYMDLLHKVSFLFSTRDPKEKGNQCNFPSKIIEGILHNRIIISTIKYKQLAGLKYFFVSSDEDELKNQIEGIIRMDSVGLIRYANQSNYAKSMFNPNRWGEIMNSLEKV